MFSMLAGALSALAHSRHIAILPVFRWISAVVLLLCAATVSPDHSYAQSAPAKPTGVSAEDGNTQIRLRWTGPNDPTITHWQYAYKLSAGSYSKWTNMPGSGSATRRHTVTGLTNNRTYKFKIRAVNAVGPGRASDEKTGEPYPAPPEKPTGFRAIPGDGKVVLVWDNADDVSIYDWQYRRKESGGSYGSWLSIPASDANTTTYTVTGLENGTEYTFQIEAYNGTRGPSSDEESATPMPAAPGKPTGLSVEAGNRKATLTWDDPDDDTITKWQYAYRTTDDYGAWVDMSGSGADTVRHIVSPIENDAVHTFKIRAVNDVGEGAESDEVSATPVASAPEKPAGLLALAGDKQVILSWTNPSDASIRKWQYAYRTAGGYGSWTDIPDSDATTIRHIVPELANGTTYTFKLRAVNDAGSGPESDEVFSTPLSVPAKPSGFKVTAGDARVVLGWDDPLNATITGWQYSFRTSGDYGAWTNVAGSRAATTGHIVTELANGVEHTFKIRAVNASGSGAESDAVAATPQPIPAKPSGFRAEAGNTQARLSWTDPGDNSISGWQYSLKTTGEGYGAWTDMPGSGAATTRYTVAGLANNVLHTFRIRAVNGSGAGAESDEDSATPREGPPEKPSGFEADAGDGEVVLTWDDPDDSSIQGWQYKSRAAGEAYGQHAENIPGSGAKTVRHVVTGLENGRTYFFVLRAANAANGEWSDERSAAPRSLRPAAPTGLSARPGEAQVALAWNDPDDPTISGWQYAVRTAGVFGAWTDIPGSDAMTTVYTTTGLENGIKYFFKLRAVNEHGNGAESDEVSATPAAVPAKPTGFTAIPGDGRVALAWDDSDNTTITGWQYNIATTGGYGGWTDIAGSDAGTTGHVVTGLDNGTAHRFKVRAINNSGPGAESDETTTTPLAVPAKPAGFAATPGDGRVALAWDDPGDATIGGWQYAFKTTGDYGSWIDIAGGDATTTGHTVAGLDNGIAHRFRLRAVNASGPGAASDEATATPVPVPAKPTGFAATPGDGRVSLQWDDPGDATITGWQYRYRTTGGYGSWIDIPDSSAATTGHTVTDLDNGAAHRFRLRAVNASGPGAASDEATATPVPVPAKPTGFTATPGDGRAVLSWDDPSDATITGWQYAVKTTGVYGPWNDIPGSGAATTGYTVTGLDNGITHRLKLRAVNGSGEGAESDGVGATPIAVPAKPTGFATTAGDGRVALVWDDPGNATITGWQYALKTTGNYGSWTDIPGSDATTTAHTVTGLDNSVAHRFKLRAVNASGPGAESGEVTATPVPVPAKPAGFTATPGDGRIALAWDDPGNMTIVHWQYRYDAGSGYGEWTDIPGSGPTTTNHDATGLDNGTLHKFRIRAVNNSGPGAESGEVTATPVPVPAKPAGFTATPGDGRIALAWDGPGDATITGWQYALKTTGDYGSWIDIPGSGATTTGYTVTDLDNGAAYRFRIRAVNASGNGVESDEATATPVAVPAKPTGFTAAPGDRRVALAWDNPGNATITGWQYRYGTTGAYGPWTDIPDSGATTIAHTVTGLGNGAAHRFRLRAVNASGAGAESDDAAATPVPVPAKPTGFAATAGDGQVSLQWSDPDDATITGWQYRYRTTGGYGGWMHITGSGAGTTSHTVTGLDNGVIYRFEVRAVNGSGLGTPSSAAAATPLAVPAKPTGLTATPGSGEVVLEWEDPADATITGWQYNQRPENGEYEADWTAILGSTATTVRHAVTGLQTGASYRFKLRADNASGAGAESDEIAATLPPVPAKPAGLTAAAGDRAVALAWDGPDDPSIASWQYRYRTTGSYGDWIDIPGSDADTTGHTVTGLAAGIPHHFRIRAINSSGSGLESDEVTAVPFAVPAKPTGFTATPGSGRVLLEWDSPDDSTITGYDYSQRQGDGEFDENWTFIADSTAATTSHTVTGLSDGTSYGFKVRAVSGERVGAESDEATATVALPAPPARPAGFTATPGDGEVALAWNDPGDPSISGWQYRYGPVGDYGGWMPVPDSNADTTGYTVTGLEYGISYAFRVRAFNAGGVGRESRETTATSLPARPTGFTATAGDREVLLEWDDPDDPSVIHWEYKQRQAEEPFGNEWTVLPKDAMPTRFTVPSLEVGVSYAFKLRAVNAGGAGAETGEVATIVPPAPARPEGFALIPGEREVSLEWKALGDPTVAVWQYKYRIGNEDGSWTDIPDSGPDTTEYKVAELEVGVSHKFRIRAANSSGFGLASDEIATVPLGRPARPTGLTATPGYGQVVLTWNDPGDPAIVRWQYARWEKTTNLCRSGGQWMDAVDAPATRYVVEALEGGIAYCFQVRACTSEDRRFPVCGPGSDPESATPKAAATPAERRTVRAVLAGLAGHVAAGADAMIGARFSGGPAQSSLVLAGREVPLFAHGREERMPAPPGGAPKATVRGIGGRELLQDSSFQVALGPPEGEGVPQWSLWHRGDLTRFEGSADAGSRYGGRLLSFWYGADMRWGKQWLAGAALARSKAEVDYAAGGGAGHLKTVLDSVHPYLLRRCEDGGTAWLTLGSGRGTIENETAGREIEIADTELATASAGFRARLPAFGGLELSASGAAGFARLEADGDARTAIGSLSATTNRQSLGIEAALEEGEAAYYASLSLRRGGVRGLSLELSGGAGSPLPASSGRADVRLRGLVWHSGREYREFGLTATVRRPADASGRGPSWSLAAAHGAAGSRNRSGPPMRRNTAAAIRRPR